MTTTLDLAPPELDAARADARERGLGYAGDMPPDAAWALAQRGDALIVDVRTAEELHYVGHVPGARHVAWSAGFPMQRNPAFIEQLARVASPDQVVLLLCRSGKRSVWAAEAATAAGFGQAFNVLEGFEGDLDPQRQRGTLNGWRRRGLPWVQE